MKYRGFVNEDTRDAMEEQFADCNNHEELAELYADYWCTIRELMIERCAELRSELSGESSKD